ncbi:psychosine receptor-like [Clarias gariepinus]|uniref:psychosine receptor-like n=1 Tax=Clarias gariepinus TaxID=13013 RepID=UPI00234CABB7|nr:psychosine receptor-like [Clarias gariepinus]
MAYATANGSNATTMSPSQHSLQNNSHLTLRNLTTLAEILADCVKTGPSPLRFPIQLVVLILALPANALLLWLLVKNRKTLSPSEVLGLNFALLGVLFGLSLPLDIVITSINARTGLLLNLSNAFAILSYIGCPLLLTSMCLERYVAVAHPVLFIKLGKWEYRAACSAIIWFLTCIVSGVIFVYTLSKMAIQLSIIINLLFLIMVGCLFGIVCVLCKKGPGEGDQNNSVVKKRALKYVVALLVPSAIIYLPMLALAPFILMINMLTENGTNFLLCTCLMMFSILPNFGVCIGPLFYMARVKQVFCHRNKKSRDTRETTTDQRT